MHRDLTPFPIDVVLRGPVRPQLDLCRGVIDLEAQNVGQLLNPRQDLLELPLVSSDNGHVINIDVELRLWHVAAEGAVEHLALYRWVLLDGYNLWLVLLVADGLPSLSALPR